MGGKRGTCGTSVVILDGKWARITISNPSWKQSAAMVIPIEDRDAMAAALRRAAYLLERRYVRGSRSAPDRSETAPARALRPPRTTPRAAPTPRLSSWLAQKQAGQEDASSDDAAGNS